MTKFVLIILTIYTVYYVGNILYDIFLNKNNPVKLEESDHFSIHEFENDHRTKPAVIGIEDVENLQTPKSFSKINFQPSTDGNIEERMDIDYWRNMFEKEQSMEDFTHIKSSDYQPIESAEYLEGDAEEKGDVKTELVSFLNVQNNENWYQLMNLAETAVQLISNENGYKVYHSSAF